MTHSEDQHHILHGQPPTLDTMPVVPAREDQLASTMLRGAAEQRMVVQELARLSDAEPRPASLPACRKGFRHPGEVPQCRVQIETAEPRGVVGQ
jgi:hypothetical protein